MLNKQTGRTTVSTFYRVLLEEQLLHVSVLAAGEAPPGDGDRGMEVPRGAEAGHLHPPALLQHLHGVQGVPGEATRRRHPAVHQAQAQAGARGGEGVQAPPGVQ